MLEKNKYINASAIKRQKRLNKINMRTQQGEIQKDEGINNNNEI
jgi:hypothetical protein